MSLLDSFTLFPDLPLELRIRVWFHTLSGPQECDITSHYLFNCTSNKWRDPIARKINRESRTETLIHYLLLPPQGWSIGWVRIADDTFHFDLDDLLEYDEEEPIFEEGNLKAGLKHTPFTQEQFDQIKYLKLSVLEEDPEVMEQKLRQWTKEWFEFFTHLKGVEVQIVESVLDDERKPWYQYERFKGLPGLNESQFTDLRVYTARSTVEKCLAQMIEETKMSNPPSFAFRSAKYGHLCDIDPELAEIDVQKANEWDAKEKERKIKEKAEKKAANALKVKLKAASKGPNSRERAMAKKGLKGERRGNRLDSDTVGLNARMQCFADLQR